MGPLCVPEGTVQELSKRLLYMRIALAVSGVAVLLLVVRALGCTLMLLPAVLDFVLLPTVTSAGVPHP